MTIFAVDHRAVTAVDGGGEQERIAGLLKRGIFAGGVGDDAHGKVAAAQRAVGKSEEVGAAAVVLQLAARQERAQMTFEHFDAEHTVDRAVVQHERDRVGDGGVRVAGERVGLDGPVAEIVGLKLAAAVVSGLKDRVEQTVRTRFGIEQRGHPARIGRDVQRLHDLRGRAFDEKVGIADRGGGRRLQVAQIQAGKRIALRAGIKVVRVEHDEDACNRAAAHGGDHFFADGTQKGERVFIAAIECVDGDIAGVDERLRGGVDAACKGGKVLRREHQALQIALAVFHLLLQQVRRVLLQLDVDAAEIENTDEQHELDQKNGEHRAQDGNENRAIRCLFVGRCLLCHKCPSFR